MTNNSFRKTAGTVFAVVAVVHALRVLNGWEVTINSWAMPMWLSWTAVAFLGYLAWSGLKSR